MTTTEREVARAHARAARTLARELARQAGNLAAEAARIADAARKLDTNPDDQTAALDLLTALADNARKPRPGALLDLLTRRTRATCVDLARALGATWQQVGTALGIDRRNAQARYAAKGDDQR